MNTIGVLCKLLIEKGQVQGLQEKLDVYLAADRLSVEEYNALTARLTQIVDEK